MWANIDVAHAQGAAWRRRQRRLRAHWRHEQLTLQMLLATYEHHAAPRGQSRARSGRWERAVLHGQVPEHPTPQAAGTEYFSLDVDVPAAGSRRDRLFALSGPQDRVQRRIVQQIVDIAPLPILDDLAPQMVEQLPDVLRFFRALSPDPEQVIEVPTFLPEDVSLRTAVREPQLVQQLVEVSTIVSWSMLQQIMEPNVDIPVVGSGAGGGFSGFLPGQYSLPAEQIVDNPVPRRRFRGVLQGLHPGQSSSAFFEQMADPGGGLQDFQPVQGPAASSSVSPEYAGLRGFRTFSSSEKSAEVAGQVDENLPEHVSLSTPAAYEAHHVARDDLWVQIMTDHEPYFWHRVERTSEWRKPPGTHPAWVRSRDGLFFHVETKTVRQSLSGTR